MAKVPRTYRLAEKTLDQIEWLAFQLGDITATDVITISVADFYERKKAELPLARVLLEPDGTFDLQVQGETALKLNEDVLAHLPEEVREDLLKGRARVGDALVYLVLAAAKSDGKIRFNRDALQGTFQNPDKEKKQ